MYCMECGKILKDSKLTCDSCGTAVNTSIKNEDKASNRPSGLIDEHFNYFRKLNAIDKNASFSERISAIGLIFKELSLGLKIFSMGMLIIFSLVIFKSVLGDSERNNLYNNAGINSSESNEKDSFIAYCSSYPLTGGYTLGGALAEKLGKSKVRQWCSCGYAKTKEKMTGKETIQVLSGELGSVDPITKKFGYESMNAIASCVEQDESTKNSNIAKSLVGLLRSQANLFKLE